MSDGSDVHLHGTDSAGRNLWMSDYLADWWEGVVRELGFRPAIVQGAHMLLNGGGADASAGFHDKGGCLDLRTWDLSATQVTAVIHATRRGGAGSWVRDHRHGMDPHIHLVLGTDHDLSTGAAWQWLNYLHGGNGLSSGGDDYHPRPDPMRLTPPDHYLKGLYDMTPEEVRAIVRDEVQAAQPGIAKAVWMYVVRPAKNPKNSPAVTEQTAQAALKKAANQEDPA
jgi:hypothetical protein